MRLGSLPTCTHTQYYAYIRIFMCIMCMYGVYVSVSVCLYLLFAARAAFSIYGRARLRVCIFRRPITRVLLI